MQPSSDSPYNARLKAALVRIGEVSTIREVAVRIMRVANDPSVGAVELAGAVGRDPALGARIIRTVNSAAYGLRRKVDRLVEAVTLLGFKRVRNLSMAALICDLFESGHTFGTYDRKRLWRHMVAVGVGARAIVGAVAHPDPEEAFLAGLLHDLGIILEDQYAHDDFVRAVEEARPDEPFAQAESRVLGFDHTELGARVADAWDFPEAVANVIAFHHRADEYEGPAEPIVLAVSVANWVCTEAGVSATGLRNVAAPSERTLERLGLKAEFLSVFADDIRSELSADDLLLVV
jgi:putative nucleotidyltransferase with HDIG domain